MARFNKIYKKTILSAVVLFFVFLIQGCAPTFYYEGSQNSSLENASNARSAVLESIIDQTKGGAFQAESTLKIIFPNSNLIKQKGILKNVTNLNQQQQAELVTLTAFVSESIQKELEAIIKIIERSQLFKTVEHKAGEFTISPEFDNADFILVAVFPTNQPALDKRFATSNSRMEWYLQARGSKRKIQIDYNQSIKIKERLGQFVSNLTKAVKRNFDDKLLSEKILASQKKSKAEAVTGPQDMDPPEISMLSTIIVKEENPMIGGKVTDVSKVIRVAVDGRPVEFFQVAASALGRLFQ